MRLNRPWRWTIGSAVAIVLFTAAVGYYRLNEAFRGDYETVRVIRMVEDYVREHDGQWPSSWEDLEATETFRECDLDSSYYRRYTAIDFELTSDQLIEKPGLIYQAVVPVSGEYICYPHAREDLDRVLETIRHVRGRCANRRLAAEPPSADAVDGDELSK